VVSLIVFLVMLGVLIFVHELGHFLVAKRAGIYVERFSIGFGRRLFGRRVGETDYCVSALPLGGYVRMAGQSDLPREQSEKGEVQLEEWEADVPEERRFTSKPPSVRAAVLFAGPFMNCLFGIALYPLVFMLGQEVPVSTMDTRVGEPIDGAPAQAAGIRLNDRIVRAAGRDLHVFEDLVIEMYKHKDVPVEIDVDRDGEMFRLEVTPTEYDEDRPPGIGVTRFEPARVGAVTEGWPAHGAGLEQGDLITHADGERVDWYRLVSVLREKAGQRVELAVERADGTQSILSLVPRSAGVLETVVLDGNGKVVAVEGDVTGLAGLLRRLKEAFGAGPKSDVARWRKGDVVVAVDGTPVEGDEIADLIVARPGAETRFTVERTAWFRSERFDIIETLGVRGMIGMEWSQEMTYMQYPPGEAIVRGVVKSFKSVDLVLTTVRQLVRGKVKISNLAGPLGIYRYTEAVWAAGLVPLMQFVAILSFNFFVLNLLPLPVLDGGQLVLVGVEAVIRRPVGIRLQIWLQRVGIVLLGLLMIVVFYNDIVRMIEDVF